MPCWSICTCKSANNGHDHDNIKLLPWEVENEWYLRKHYLLESHSDTDGSSNHKSADATSHYKDECLHKVNELNSSPGIPHGSQDAYLLGLFEQVGAHARSKREEAKEHGDRDDDVEDNVKDVFHLSFRFNIIKVVLDPHSINLVLAQILLDSCDHFFDVLLIVRLLETNHKLFPSSVIERLEI